MIKKLRPYYSLNNKISYRLLLLTVAFSAFITLFITMLQLYVDYKNGINSINQQFNLVVESHSDSLVEGIWVYDEDQINIQLKGIVNLPDILFTSIDLDRGTHYEYGDIKDENVIEKKFKLNYFNDIKDVYLGELTVIADVNRLYDELKNKIVILLLSQGIKTFIVSLFILYLFQILITKHIQEISSYTNNLSFNKKNEPLVLNKIIFKNQRDELDSLVDSINNMQTEIYNSYVEVKNQERVLQEQSRLVQMGEMISMIAHQWRQPLAAISMTVMNMNVSSQLNEFDLSQKEDAEKYEGFVNNSLDEINLILESLTRTIDDFRSFYKQNKEIVTIELENVILKSLGIIKSLLINENIEIIEEYNSNQKISIYDSELMQVILNILKNAQDNFSERQIKDPYIKITTENRTISICDNGGGIPENIIEKIFDPYFSTKTEKNGTGIGLYMSKIIIEEHHKGKLSVQNTDDGVCFTIKLGIISEK